MDLDDPWTRVSHEREAFQDAVPPPDEAARFPEQGERLVGPPEGRTVYDMESYVDGVSSEDPAPDQAHEQTQVHNLVVTRRLVARVGSDGTVTVRSATDRRLAGGRIDFGIRVRGFGLPDRIYRKTAPVEIAEDGSIEGQLSLWRLLTKKHDVDGSRKMGRGVAALRLRLLDAALGVERSEDVDVPFRCEPAPCAPGSQMIQLPSIRFGPFIDLVDRSGAVVSFETDVPTVARVVVFGREGSARSFDATRASTRHEIVLSDLEAGRPYRYWVFVQDGRGEIHESTEGAFRTEPAVPAPFRFAVMSDSRSGLGESEADVRGSNRRALVDLSRLIYQRDADFVVFVGDLINGYTTEPGAYRHELDGFMAAVQPIASRVPFYEVMGNHEALIEAWSSGFLNDRPGTLNSQSIFAATMVNPTNAPPHEAPAPTYAESVFSFDYGGVHLAVVNSNYWFRSHHERTDHPRYGSGVREGMVTEAQLDWLDADLADAAARGIRHSFVFTHEPAFPNGGHVDDAMYWEGRFADVIQMRDRFWGLLSKHRVVAAFFGDEHNYTRTLIDASVNAAFATPVWQIVTGGAGAPYYALDDSVPWAEAVQVFRPNHHFCEISVDGSRVVLRVIDRAGQTIDQAQLR